MVKLSLNLVIKSDLTEKPMRKAQSKCINIRNFTILLKISTETEIFLKRLKLWTYYSSIFWHVKQKPWTWNTGNVSRLQAADMKFQYSVFRNKQEEMNYPDTKGTWATQIEMLMDDMLKSHLGMCMALQFKLYYEHYKHTIQDLYKIQYNISQWYFIKITQHFHVRTDVSFIVFKNIKILTQFHDAWRKMAYQM